MKKPLVSIPEEYPNLDMIGNVRADSVLYDLPSERTGRKGRPTGHQATDIFAGFVKAVENSIKSQRILRALKQLIYRQGYHL